MRAYLRFVLPRFRTVSRREGTVHWMLPIADGTFIQIGPESKRKMASSGWQGRRKMLRVKYDGRPSCLALKSDIRRCCPRWRIAERRKRKK